MNEADRSGGSVWVIAAWRWRPVRGTLVAATTPESLREWTERMAGEVVAEAQVAHPAVPVRLTVVEGVAADVLVHAVLTDDLLVLGSHGHGQLHQAVLGSTTETCVRRAPCPVVVVPASMRAPVAYRARSAVAASVVGIAPVRPGEPLVASSDRIEF
jgi:nucleotide-binding universal stress UspA family protein